MGTFVYKGLQDRNKELNVQDDLNSVGNGPACLDEAIQYVQQSFTIFSVRLDERVLRLDVLAWIGDAPDNVSPVEPGFR